MSALPLPLPEDQTERQYTYRTDREHWWARGSTWELRGMHWYANGGEYRCDCCGESEDCNGRRLSIDFDADGRVRGLLCNTCFALVHRNRGEPAARVREYLENPPRWTADVQPREAPGDWLWT